MCVRIWRSFVVLRNARPRHLSRFLLLLCAHIEETTNTTRLASIKCISYYFISLSKTRPVGARVVARICTVAVLGFWVRVRHLVVEYSTLALS